MDFISLLMIAVGLAMDAFAVSITNGIAVKRFNRYHAAKQGIFFGGFQAGMTSAGWFLGSSVKDYIERFDHWIAFILLGLLGINMIREALCDEEKNNCKAFKLTVSKLTVQAIATSIDAFARWHQPCTAFHQYNIRCSGNWSGGVYICCQRRILGRIAGNALQKRAGIFGGIVLILIGVKTLMEHVLF